MSGLSRCTISCLLLLWKKLLCGADVGGFKNDMKRVGKSCAEVAGGIVSEAL
jgi:hypothetical protein